ncbi:tail fiber protein (endogenous virus) [Clostridium phage phiCT453A]|uniref:tail fiber protein n=1 Tax=Clostridium phage phiCT453A TaxID=1567012 RepID=UPI000572A8FF|nr:phage tail protein [Clostridium tetani]YP_009216697.1 tail fiber protein [Clostridium phage phiCT453A]AJA42543.1 tail fiber protein [Clostridium phage phiCT453A]
MAEQFYTILTAIGKAKIANATALGNKVNFTTLKVGDSNGKYYNPTETQEDLINAVWQGNINSISVDKKNPNWIVIEVIIPSNIGGFVIREAGIFDDEGDLIAIGKYPETYKPKAEDGSTKDLIIKMILEVSNTSTVTLKVDPTVILATKEDIGILENKIENMKLKYKTYEELKTLVENKELVPGQGYLMTDYRTKYEQPISNVIKTLEVEPLLLTAISNEAFAPVVYSPKHPKDIIYYDIDNNVCEDDTTPRTGFITYRELGDTGNKAPQDCRYMTWVRYKPNPYNYYLYDTLVLYEEWSVGETAELNVVYKVGNTLYMATEESVPTSATDKDVFFPIYHDINVPLLSGKTVIISETVSLNMDDNVAEVLTFGNNCFNNSIEPDEKNRLHENVFISDCSNNVLGKNCKGNSFGIENTENMLSTKSSNNVFIIKNKANTLGIDSTSNYFGINNERNSIGKNTYWCTFGNNNTLNILQNNNRETFFGEGNSSNTIEQNSVSNTFISKNIGNKVGVSSDRNIFSKQCRYNTLGVGCNRNVFGASSTRNTFESGCNGNKLGHGCANNTFGNQSCNNTLSNNCDYNIFATYSTKNTLGKYCVYNTFGVYCHNNTLGEKCLQNNLGTVNSVNVFGDQCVNIVTDNRCMRNTFGNGCDDITMLSFCYDNTFANDNSTIFVKNMANKSTEGVTDFVKNTTTYTVERMPDGEYRYWSMNKSGAITVGKLY